MTEPLDPTFVRVGDPLPDLTRKWASEAEEALAALERERQQFQELRERVGAQIAELHKREATLLEKERIACERASALRDIVRTLAPSPPFHMAAE